MVRFMLQVIWVSRVVRTVSNPYELILRIIKVQNPFHKQIVIWYFSIEVHSELFGVFILLVLVADGDGVLFEVGHQAVEDYSHSIVE